MKWNRKKRIEELPKLLKERILVLDGAMGTMIQAEKLTEEDYRGERFKDHKKSLFGVYLGIFCVVGYLCSSQILF